MKNIWIIPFSALALSLSAVSCTQTDVVDEIQNSQGGNNTQGDKDLVWTTFKAYVPQIGNPSRTSLEEGNKVFWNDGDAIAITGRWAYEPEEIYKCVTKIEGGKSATADFEGDVSYSEMYYAFYPYALFSSQRDGDYYFTIPSIQEAVAGTFANNINPSWAMTYQLGGSLHFENIGALVKFTLEDGAQDIKNVMLVPNKEDSKLSGDFIYDVTDIENSQLRVSDEWDHTNASSVVLEGEFKSGCSYYFVVAPIDGILSEGFKLVFEKTDGSHYVIEGKAGVINEISSSEIVNIGTVNLAGVEFKNNIADFNFIKAVDNYFDNKFGWTKDEDGTVPLTEENLALMREVESLHIDYAGLSSLDDLKYFTGLKLLECSNNELESVDLNFLTELVELSIGYAGLTNLKIDKLANLQRLNIYSNKIKNLDYSNFPNLLTLNCGNNGINEIDLSVLPNLEILDCSDNDILNLNLSNNNKLRSLRCEFNPISSLELGNLIKLETLDCGWSELSDLDLSNLTLLKRLDISSTGIKDINVPAPEKLEELIIAYCPIKQIDLAKYPALSYLLCYGMPDFMTELDFSNNPKMGYINCDDSGITSLNVSNCLELNGLHCSGNKLRELDLTNNTNLSGLYCENQKLPNNLKLQLYLNTAQQDLWNNISGNHIESVDVHFVDSESSSN